MKIKVTVVDTKAEQLAWIGEQAPLYVEQKSDMPTETTSEEGIVQEEAVTLN